MLNSTIEIAVDNTRTHVQSCFCMKKKRKTIPPFEDSIYIAKELGTIFTNTFRAYPKIYGVEDDNHIYLEWKGLKLVIGNVHPNDIVQIITPHGNRTIYNESNIDVIEQAIRDQIL